MNTAEIIKADIDAKIPHGQEGYAKYDLRTGKFLRHGWAATADMLPVHISPTGYASENGTLEFAIRPITVDQIQRAIERKQQQDAAGENPFRGIK